MRFDKRTGLLLTAALLLGCSSARIDDPPALPAFNEVFWKTDDPHTHLLYLVVTEADAGSVPTKAVVKRLRAALAVARQKRNRAVPFNVVFFVRRERNDRYGNVSGFSLEQLEEMAMKTPEEAERLVAQHSWMLEELPKEQQAHP